MNINKFTSVNDRNAAVAAAYSSVGIAIEGTGTLPHVGNVAERLVSENRADGAAVESALRTRSAWDVAGLFTRPLATAARMAAVVAAARGYDLYDGKVRTAILVAALGRDAAKVLASADIVVGDHDPLPWQIDEEAEDRISEAIAPILLEKKLVTPRGFLGFVYGAGGAISGLVRVREAWKNATKFFPFGMSSGRRHCGSSASGSVLLWDVANLLGGEAGSMRAARMLGTISKTFGEHGFRSRFFIERRAFTWACCQQRSDAELEEFRSFARHADFTIIPDGADGARREVDEVILKMASEDPNAICVSRDHFADYADAFPGVVGTRRVRRYRVFTHDGASSISVEGLGVRVVVDDGEHAAEPTGLAAVASKLAERGDRGNAERLFAKVAKKDPAAYRSIAKMYADGGNANGGHAKAIRYDKLARDGERKARQSARRYERLWASGACGCGDVHAHFSRSRREAMELAARRAVRGGRKAV